MARDEKRRFQKRKATEPWRAWYDLKRWRGTAAGKYMDGLRGQVFIRDMFTCQRPGCGRVEGNTKLLVAHHKRPHRGDATLFWDPKNLITICKPCHDGPVQAQERREHITGNWY